MAHPGIFSIDHLELIRKLYLRQLLPPREVARELNAKFQTTFTARQISTMLVERGLSKRRKLAKGKAILAANDFTSLAAVQQRAELATTKEIVAGHLRLGQTITRKAQLFVESAPSAKTLSSASSAARTGISIVRQSSTRSAQLQQVFQMGDHAVRLAQAFRENALAVPNPDCAAAQLLGRIDVPHWMIADKQHP